MPRRVAFSAACVLMLAPFSASAAPPKPLPVGVTPAMLSGPHAQRAVEILERPFLHSMPPAEVFKGDAALFRWLVDHPAWVASFWRQVGIQVGEVQPTPDGWKSWEDDSSSAEFHLLYRSPELRLVYATLETRIPPLVGKFHAEAVLVYRAEEGVSSTGVPLVRHSVEAFVTAKGPTLNTLIRLAKGGSERAVSQLVQETMAYFSLMCRVMQMRPDWAAVTAKRLAKKLSPAEAAELRALLAQLPQRPPGQHTAGRSGESRASRTTSQPTNHAQGQVIPPLGSPTQALGSVN
jgi:hypothetical protein